MLADWVTSAENPYFAKATVDAVWGYFFGISLLEPIMEPSDDSPIVYPELLDEMARQFAEHNFDLKFLIKAIVHTEAYQRQHRRRQRDQGGLQLLHAHAGARPDARAAFRQRGGGHAL